MKIINRDFEVIGQSPTGPARKIGTVEQVATTLPVLLGHDEFGEIATAAHL